MKPERKVLYHTLIFVIALHSLSVIILSSVPPISRDALIHHLTIPKLYLEAGKMYEIPSMFFSYFPGNLDLLYILPVYLQFEIAAKYIHFLFALLTALFIYKYLTQHLDKLYGLLGAAVFLTTPVIIKLSITAYVDLGLIFFTWICLFYILKWLDNSFRFKYLFLAGIACGLALGTKYNGLILLLICSVFVPLLYSRETNKSLSATNAVTRNKNSLHGILLAISFILTALLIFSPWAARNYIWTNNPIYPLYNSIFNPAPQKNIKEKPQEVKQSPKSKITNNEKKGPRNSFWYRKHIYNESFLQSILVPIRMFFEGRDDNPKYFDGKLNPFLLLFSLLSFIPLRNGLSDKIKKHRNILTFFSCLFTLFVLFKADFRIRYASPIVPALSVLSVFGISNVSIYLQNVKKTTYSLCSATLITAILMAGIYNASYIYDQFKYVQPFVYISGKVDRDTYISHFRQEHPVIVHANNILPEQAKILCLSIGDRTYYLERSTQLSERFHKISQPEKITEEVIMAKVDKTGSTHIIINMVTFQGWVFNQPQSVQQAYYNYFTNNTKLLYEKNGVKLLEIM